MQNLQNILHVPQLRGKIDFGFPSTRVRVLLIYISPTIKVNADTIGFQKAHRFTKFLHRNVNDANDVVYEASTFKCFFRPELQGTTIACFRECF